MGDAWAMTYREFVLLCDVKSKSRSMVRKQAKFDTERLDDFEQHLRNIGVLK